MCDCAEVHYLLHAAFGEQCESRLAGRHNVLMITENAQGVGGNRPGAHMKYAGKQLSGNFVHIGNH